MTPRWFARSVLALCCAAAPAALASGLPVTAAHPRLLLSPSVKTRLLGKKTANEASWTAMKAVADTLSTYSIFPYTYATRTQEPDNTIFYDYQGSDWFDSTLPLGLAYQMTSDTKYSNKLLQLADELLRAQSDPANNPPNGLPPLEPDSYFPTRFVGPTAAIIYDWCYDQLGATRKSQLIALMNAYFDDMRANAYQSNAPADGNYFGGHLICAAFMGYATYGDNPRAQEMIDWARIRFDGTASALVPPAEVPDTHVDQCFEGPYPSGSIDRGGSFYGAPFKSGLDFQGWAYGTGNFTRLFLYLFGVQSATGEDLFTARMTWFSAILRAYKHAVFPNGSFIDPTGDWGGDYGATATLDVPLYLSAFLAGSPDGPYAQHLYASEVVPYVFPGGYSPSLSEWERFYLEDTTRPSSPLAAPPYYSAFGPAYPAGGATNGALPYFLMRSDWGTSATWASATMGSAYYDDHQHRNFGHIEIARGGDYLLVDSSQWMGPAGSIGLVGSSNESDRSAEANTLLFDDFADYMYPDTYYFGGQAYWGADQVVAADESESKTYVRSDLTSAYYRASWDPSDLALRKLDSFYRSFLYLRSPNLFVVLDQVQAKSSANPRGPYRKHLRWHLPNVPVVSGKNVHVDQGSSRLWVETVLPANAVLTVVDESSNPDPCDGTVPSCTPSGPDVGTWRIEVKEPTNALGVTFLTVLAPGQSGLAAPTSAAVSTLDSKMTGVFVTPSSGPASLALFNAQAGQVPAPITSTSYNYSGASDTTHTLAGLVPSAAYNVTYASNVVTVTQSGGGSLTTSAAGVLDFTLNAIGPRVVANPATLYFSDIAGAALPGDQPVHLTNGGSGSYAFTTSTSTQTGGAWLSAAPPSGSVTAALVDLTVHADTTGLVPAVYHGSVTVTSSGTNGSPQTVDVTLRVLAPPLGAASFYTVPPCRIVDTRNPNGTFGGPALVANATRLFPLAGRCLVPSDAKAIAANVTAVNTGAAGFLSLYPADQAQPDTSSLNFVAGQTRANNAMLRLSPTGQVAVVAVIPSGQTDFLLDVVGYYR